MPARKFLKMSWNAKPMATVDSPSTWMSCPGLKPGTAITRLTSRPTSTMAPWASRPSTRPTLCWRPNRWLTLRISVRTPVAAKKKSRKTTRPMAM